MGEIIFNPEKISLLPGNGYDFYGVEKVKVRVEIVEQEKEWHVPVTAGTNELSDRDFSLLQSMPEYQWFVEQGILVLPNPPPTDTPSPPVDEVPNISNVSITKADPIIKSETRVSVLKQWLDDPRTGIKDLVGDRLLELGEMPNV